MLFDLMSFDRCSLILLLDLIDEFVDNLLSDMFDVSTTFCRGNTVDKTDLVEEPIAHCKRHFPSIIDNLMHDRRFWCPIKHLHAFLHFLLRVGRDVHVDILFETFDFDAFPVEIDFDTLDTPRKIVHTSFHHGLKVGVKGLHAESFQVGLERDVGVLFAGFVGGNFGLSDFTHVVGPCLRVLETGIFIGGFDGEFGAENVAEFCAVTVSTTDDFFLVVVVVAGCEKMAKDQLGDIDLFFLWN